MKKIILLTAFLLFPLYFACGQNSNASKPNHKAAIAQAEKDFEKIVAEKGIADGFYHFADENAVIKREHDTLIIGKEKIRNYYSNSRYKKASVTWHPDFIEVSEKGDLAYTYGKYTWTSTDAEGKVKTAHGIFHTVWKKQPDGSWKYVWD